MKRTEPTVSLLARNPDGSPARQYTPASHTDIRKRFAPLFDEAERIEQERKRATLERENVTQMRRPTK
jgi:hypothetical protein